MNDDTHAVARRRREQVRDALNDTYEALDEAWRALGRDRTLSTADRNARRKAIKDQMAELELREGRLDEAALRARDHDPELARLIDALEGAVGDIRGELDRIRRAERTAQSIERIVGHATTAIATLARIIV